MKAKLKAFWKRSKWVILSVAAALVAVLAFILRGLFTKKPSQPVAPDTPQPLPPIDERIREKVTKAEEEALVARVEARVQAETQRAELDEIAKVEDGAERRRRLAEMLRRL